MCVISIRSPLPYKLCKHPHHTLAVPFPCMLLRVSRTPVLRILWSLPSARQPTNWQPRWESNPRMSESKSDALTTSPLGYDARGVTMPLAIELYIKGFRLRLAHATRNHHQVPCQAVGDRRNRRPLHRTCTSRTMCYRNYSGRNRLHMVVYHRLLSISIN